MNPYASTNVGLEEAKNPLSKLLDRVEQGEEITITRHNQAVARLVPAKRPSLPDAVNAIEAMRTLRSSNPVAATTAEIRSWKDDGRPRYPRPAAAPRVDVNQEPSGATSPGVE